MKNFIKNYGVIVIMLCIQGYFFVSNNADGVFNYEMFFFSWAAIWFAVFFFSRNGGSNVGGGVGFRGSSEMTYAMSAKSMTDKDNGSKSERERRNVLSLEFMYLGMCILNVVGYIVYVVFFF